MKLNISTAVKTITGAVIASLFVIGYGAVEAEAVSFQTFIDNETPQVCDAFDAVFNDGKCIKPDAGREGDVLGDRDEAKAIVSLIDNRCVAEDGVAEIKLENIDLFELKNRSTGDVVSRGGNTANFRTFTDLSDGEYKFTGRSDAGNDSVDFTVDCDEDGNGGGGPGINERVSASCDVSPDSPKVGDEVNWGASASDGDGDYTYIWSGDVGGSRADVSVTYAEAGKKEGYVTVRSDGKQDTARCSVDVQEGDDETPGPTFRRTIEEF